MSKVKVKLQNNTGKDLNFQYYLGNTYLDAGKEKEATIEAGRVKASFHGKVILTSPMKVKRLSFFKQFSLFKQL